VQEQETFIAMGELLSLQVNMLNVLKNTRHTYFYRPSGQPKSVCHLRGIFIPKFHLQHCGNI